MSSAAIARPRSNQETAPSAQDINNLAYALWQGRGSPQGSSEQNWIEAERQLREATTGTGGVGTQTTPIATAR